MATLTIYSDHSRTLDGIIKYIASNEDHNNAVCHYSANGVDPCRAARDMLGVKNCYGKLNGTEYLQIIVSLGEEEYESPDDLTRFIQAMTSIADMMFVRYSCQIAWAIHGNTDNLHAHFILNTVNYMNGSKFQIRKGELYNLKELVSDILAHYQFSKILTHSNTLM